MSEGSLIVCATPIGNLGDVSKRLAEVLRGVDIVYSEDTRRTSKLLAHIGSEAPLRSLFAGNERSRSAEVVDKVRGGNRVALVSDAGVPNVSDPGSAAVRAVLDAGLEVEVVPGPSAVTTALAASGFTGDRFCFEGFLPKKGKDRMSRLQRLSVEDRPVVLFVAPHRLVEDLADLSRAVGDDREIAVAREMTKLHEEYWRGTLANALERWGPEEARGEFTIVVGPGSGPDVSVADGAEEAKRLVGEGLSMSAAAREVAASTGLPRREIYAALLADQERN